VTVVVAFMVTEHPAVPVHAPPQPAKTHPVSGVALSATTVPRAYVAEHVEPQLMPAGLLVTVPDPDVVTLSEYDPSSTASWSARCAVPPRASVACTVKLLVATAVGVPVMAPVVALSARPAGSAPLVTDQVYGVLPPVAASVVL
jgi:hypothetical protein